MTLDIIFKLYNIYKQNSKDKMDNMINEVNNEYNKSEVNVDVFINNNNKDKQIIDNQICKVDSKVDTSLLVMNKNNIIIRLLLIVFMISILIRPISSTTLLSSSFHYVPQIGQFHQSSQSSSFLYSQQFSTYYDINQDQHSDIITIQTRFSMTQKSIQKSLVLYLWSDKEQKFMKQTIVSLNNLQIKSVMVTEFYQRYEKIQRDVIIVYDSVKLYQEGQQNKYSVMLIKVQCNKEQNQQGKMCKFVKTNYVIKDILQIDNKLPSLIVLSGKITLIYQYNHQVMVMYFTNKNQLEQIKYQIKPLKDKSFMVYQSLNNNNLKLGYQLSYFGDYNLDGIADLIIAQKYQSSLQLQLQHTRLLFFKYDKSITKFTYETVYDLSSIQSSLNTQFVFFTLNDINFDGLIDLIILFKNGLLQIHYNNIQNKDNLLIFQNGSPKFTFDFNANIKGNQVAKIQRIYLKNVNNNQVYKVKNDSVVTFGDINNDGYDDFIVDVIEIVDHKEKSVSMLMINQQCNTETEICGDLTYNSNFYTLNKKIMFNIRKFTRFNLLPTSYRSSQSIQMSFIDLYKDGKLDLLSHRLSSYNFTTNDNSFHRQEIIQIYYNYGYYDSFFMKITVVSGNNYIKDYQNVITIGASINCYVTSLSGVQLPKTGRQLAQVGRVKQMPYVFFGLGRTNNYVNYLTVTIPYISMDKLYQSQWTPIIPNSQIIIVTNNDQKWQLTTFIQPTKKMAMVTLLVILSLIIIGAVIWNLSNKEKQQDKENIQVMYTILK